MIDFLMKFHFDKCFRLNGIVSPADIPVKSVWCFLFFPSKVFSYLANHWILTIYFKKEIPDVLMTIFCLFLLLAFLSFLGAGEHEIYLSYDSESDSYYLESFIYAVRMLINAKLYLHIWTIYHQAKHLTHLNKQNFELISR